MVCLLAVAVVGTQSRGGLITLLGVGLVYLFLNRRNLVSVALGVLILALGLSFVVTDEYVERIETIQQADEDGSFQGRTMAWKMSIYIAIDNPMFGGGPYAVQSPDVWRRYLPYYDESEFFRTRPVTVDYKAAHSIYFQVLGDSGFGGFLVFMTTLLVAVLSSFRIIRFGRRIDDPALQELGRAVLISMSAIMLGGAAVSIAYYDLLFAPLALISVVSAACARQRRSTARIAVDARRAQMTERVT